MNLKEVQEVLRFVEERIKVRCRVSASVDSTSGPDALSIEIRGEGNSYNLRREFSLAELGDLKMSTNNLLIRLCLDFNRQLVNTDDGHD